MLATEQEDSPLGIQLLGSRPEFILPALEIVNSFDYALLDFNSACPERKVIRRGEGASLLKEPKKLNELLKLVVKNSRFPVTVKIRSGWDKNSVNGVDVALYAQDAGVKALFIHGRTRTQLYSGSVDYNIIANVKKALKIPVIASGDIFSIELAKKMFDETGCDGIAVARGCLGNPWLFRELNEYFGKGSLPEKPGISDIKEVMRQHFDSCAQFYGPKRGVVVFRKFFIWYTRGFKNIRPYREKVSRIKTPEEMRGLIDIIK